MKGVKGMQAFNRRITSLVALMALALSAPLAQAPPAPDRQTALAELDAAIAADFAKDGIGGVSIGVVSGATLVWSKHYGYAETETKRAPTNDTTYRIGSITKQFTALALLQLVEDGRMRLTDPLEKYVPEIKAIKNTRRARRPSRCCRWRRCTAAWRGSRAARSIRSGRWRSGSRKSSTACPRRPTPTSRARPTCIPTSATRRWASPSSGRRGSRSPRS
jgi:hypothetical protein